MKLSAEDIKWIMTWCFSPLMYLKRILKDRKGKTWQLIWNSRRVFPIWKSEAKTNDGPASGVPSNQEGGEGSCWCQSCVVRLTHDDLRAEKQIGCVWKTRAPCWTRQNITDSNRSSAIRTWSCRLLESVFPVLNTWAWAAFRSNFPLQTLWCLMMQQHSSHVPIVTYFHQQLLHVFTSLSSSGRRRTQPFFSPFVLSWSCRRRRESRTKHPTWFLFCVNLNSWNNSLKRKVKTHIQVLQQ